MISYDIMQTQSLLQELDLFAFIPKLVDFKSQVTIFIVSTPTFHDWTKNFISR